MFSQTVEYALRAVVHLADQAPLPRTTDQIAKATLVPKPYLSKVIQGLCRSGIVRSKRGIGGGVVLVQMADLCVASETTRFSYPEARIGTTGGGVSSIVSRMPHKIAMEFLLVGEELSVERAYQIGFVNRIAPRGQHLVQAQEMAAKIAGNAPLVVQGLKKLARDAMPKGPLETVAEARRILDPIRTSEDVKEGVAAFREKRKPKFTGK